MKTLLRWLWKAWRGLMVFWAMSLAIAGILGGVLLIVFLLGDILFGFLGLLRGIRGEGFLDPRLLFCLRSSLLLFGALLLDGLLLGIVLLLGRLKVQPYLTFMSLRYLRSHKIIYFSIAGVAMGIMVMIVVTSVMGGFSRDIRARIRGMQSDLVLVQADPTVFLDYDENLLGELRRIPGVRGVAPRIEWEAWLQHKGSYRTVRIVGIDPDQEKGLSKLDTYFAAPDFEAKTHFDFKDEATRREVERAIVIGSEFPMRGLSRFALTSVRPNGGVYNKEFQVVGHFKSGMAEYDHATVFLHLRDAQRFLRLDEGDKITTVSITLENYERDIAKVRAAVLEVVHRHTVQSGRRCSGFGHPYGSCYKYQTQTWEEAKSILLQAVSVEKGIQIIILFFIVIVAGFNIIAIYTLVVRSKTRDIGILRALGASKGGVIVVFLLSGMFCGLVGSLIGIGAGLLFSSNVNWIADRIEEASREFNQLPRGTARVTLAALVLSVVALIMSWVSFYRRERATALPLGLVAGGLIAAASWLFLTWLAPHSGCYFGDLRDHPQSALLRTAIPLVAGGIPILFALIREPIRKLRGDGAWSFLSLVATLSFSALILSLVGVTAISTSIVALQPQARWPGLELFPRDVYYLDRIPVFVDTSTIGLIVVLTLVVSLIFSIYPALKAASYDPIEAIRDE